MRGNVLTSVDNSRKTSDSEAASAASEDNNARAEAPPIPSASRSRTVAPVERGKGFRSKAVSVVRSRSPFVGRENELRQIRAAIEQSTEFCHPQLITIVGNQGTGKTRLVQELLAGLDDGIAVYGCSAARGSSRYGAITRLLQDRFGVFDQKTGSVPASFREQVQTVFGDQRVAEVLHVLGRFLSLPFPESPFLRILTQSPQQYDEISRTVLRRFVEADARQKPLLLIVDDLQWADDASLSLLRELGEGLTGSPVTLLVCTRPELMVRMSGWGEGITEHLRVDLGNLEPEFARVMLRQLLEGCAELPEDIVEDAVEMTGGNPHFIDQLVRLFLANGTVNTTTTPWTLHPERALETELPITVEEAIEARIASLEPEERDVLEKGAVFGNVFWTGGVIALTRIEQARKREHTSTARVEVDWGNETESTGCRVAKCVEELVKRDYLLRLDDAHSTLFGETELVFKHNLERELIAQSTDRAKLSHYHRLAAQWLTAKSARDALAEHGELVGQLYAAGGDKRRASSAYLDGADHARERYDNEEAVRLYRMALEFYEEDDAVARLDALHNLGDVLELIGRTQEAKGKFALMLREAWLFDHHAKGGAASSRLGRIHRRLGEYERALFYFRMAQALFKRTGDERGLAATLDDIGQVHWLQGAYAEALSCHQEALSRRRALEDLRSIALSLANVGRVHRETGAFDAACSQFREALELRRAIEDLPGTVQSLCDLAGVYAADGSSEAAVHMFHEARDLAREIGDQLALSEVLSGLGECLIATGEKEEALSALSESLEIAQRLGYHMGEGDCRRRLAMVHLSRGEHQLALENASFALEIGKRIGSPLHIGRAHQALAETVFAMSQDLRALSRAETHFRGALEAFTGLRNEIDLARCYRSFAKHREYCQDIEEATRYRKLADEIFERLHGASFA